MNSNKKRRLLAFVLAMAMLLGTGSNVGEMQVNAQSSEVIGGDFTIVIPMDTQGADGTTVIDFTTTQSTSDTAQTTATEITDATQTTTGTTQTTAVTTQETPTTQALRLDRARALTACDMQDNEITLTWRAQYNTASGFQILRRGQDEVSYEEIGTVVASAGSGTYKYVDQTFIKGVSFSYKVVPYHVLEDGQIRNGTESNAVTVKRPIAVSKIKKCVRKGKKVTLTWKKISGVTGYEIWRVTDSGQKRVKKVKTNKNTCTLKKVSNKTDINYKIRPYVKYKGYAYTGEFSDEVTLYTTNNKKVADKLKKLQKQYPSYSYWNHMGKNIYNSSTLTQTPCNHSVYGTKYCNIYFCPNGNIGLQCYGFAWKMSDLIYGKNAKIKNHKSFKQAKMGDVIRYNGHSVIILEKHKDYILAGECNVGGTCMIYWGRKITKSELKNATYSHRY